MPFTLSAKRSTSIRIFVVSLLALCIACGDGDAKTAGVGDDGDGGKKPSTKEDSGSQSNDADSAIPLDSDAGNTQALPDAGDSAVAAADSGSSSRGFSFPKSCTTFDPAKVYVHGALAGVEGGHGIADPSKPSNVCPGFISVTHLAVRPSDGTILVVSNAFMFEGSTIPLAIKVQRPDPFVFDFDKDHYVSPDDAWKNDDTLVTTCPDSTLVSYEKLLLKPLGQTTFTCNGNNYVFPGNEAAPGYEVIAHGHDDYMLVRTKASPVKLGVLHDTTFTQLDTQWTAPEFHARARTGGFWLAIPSSSTGVAQQVAVDHDGSTQVMGDYAGSPSPYSNKNGGVLDAAGNLWQMVGNGSITAFAVIRREVKPGTSSIVYSMSDADPDMTVRPPRAYVNLDGATLFTGP